MVTSRPPCEGLARLLGGLLLLPFLLLTLIPAHVMPGRGADGTLTMVLCVDGGEQTVTIDLANGAPVRQAKDGRCDWACAQMALADLAPTVMPVLILQVRQVQMPVQPAVLMAARATGLPPATGPPALI